MFVWGCAEAEDDRRPPARVAAPVEAFELDDAIWIRESDGQARRLTADRVDGFDRQALAAKQREGEVILYWAAVPAPSPDGRFVAYASNREAVTADTSGQSIWLAEVRGGAEGPLLALPGRSLRPIGWLEGELLYIGDHAPGVWSVDPRSRVTRRVATGTALAVARDGSALVVADGIPDSVSVRIVTADGVIDVPPPPEGWGYLAQARIGPDDDLVLLEAAADRGRLRRFLVFDIDGRRLRAVNDAVAVDGRTLDASRIGSYLEHHIGFTSRGGRVFCSWSLLGADARAAYVWALCEEWLATADSLATGSGVSLPVVLLVDGGDDSLRVASHSAPRDGDRYARDLRALFPVDVRRRMTGASDRNALRLVTRETAKRCFERSSRPCLPLAPGNRTAPPAIR